MISFQGIEVAQGAKEIPFVGAFDVASDTGALMPRIVVQLSNMEVFLGIMVDELKRDKTISMDAFFSEGLEPIKQQQPEKFTLDERHKQVNVRVQTQDTMDKNFREQGLVGKERLERHRRRRDAAQQGSGSPGGERASAHDEAAMQFALSAKDLR